MKSNCAMVIRVLHRIVGSRRAFTGAAVLIAGLLATFAMPVKTWRTGEHRLPPLAFAPVDAAPHTPRRLWIDTDAACGLGRRTDPDDCFAIVLLAQAPDLEIVGISTVFGNAPRNAVDDTTRELAALLSAEVGRVLPVYSGSAAPLADSPPRTAAHEALKAALKDGPLTFVELGPLTNLALVLGEQPTLRSQVARLVTVMGRRPGHLFHPAEGAHTGILFGHGPVFRDFNFTMDERASSQIIALNIPTSFIPYDAARRIEITASDLDRLAVSGGATSWVAKRARGWQSYWLEEIGREGFYPFDLLAAAYVVEPRQFRCAPVQAWVGADPMLLVPLWKPMALLVGQDAVRIEHALAIGSGLYCAELTPGLKRELVNRLTGWRSPMAPNVSMQQTAFSGR
jgi:purine nucleosidase